MRSAAHVLKRTFLHPFQNWRRSATFLGVFSGCFGFTLVNVTSAYDLGGDGLVPLLSYFGTSMALAGFILYPLLYMGFCTFDSVTWRILVLASQALAFIAFLILPKQAIYQGLAAGLLASPFWTAYHIAMVQNTTQENRAFEISLSSFLGVCGSTAAVVVSGILLTRTHVQTAIDASFGALFLGSLSILVATKRKHNASIRTFLTQARALVNDNPYLVRRIIAQSIVEMPSFILAALMHVLNFSAAMTSVMLASRIAAEFLLAPAVGHFVHTRRNKGFGLGMLLIGGAWLFLLVSPKDSISVIIFMIGFGMGLRFAFNSLTSGLYEMQKYASMMWCEVFLCVGRSLCMIFIIPLLYYDPRLYMLALAVLAALFIVFNRIWMRKWKIA